MFPYTHPGCMCPAQAGPKAKIALTDEEITALTKRTQEGGTEVVLAKAGKVRNRIIMF